MAYKLYWGGILRDLRTQYHLTQGEIADLLHLSRQQYSNMETGRIQPTPEIIAILSEIYDYDLYQYAIQSMPDDMLAEQYIFKTNMPIAKSLNKSKKKNK